MIDVAANLSAVRARIARAAARAGRDPQAVRLIAVSKTKSADAVRAAIDAGATDIGENYVQEAQAKRAAVGDGASLAPHRSPAAQQGGARGRDLRLHPDRRQRGAGRGAVAQRRRPGRTLRVLVEVRLGGEATKNGIEPAGAADLARGAAAAGAASSTV